MNVIIDVNIWDDFYDDGHVPENDIQETYAYIEAVHVGDLYVTLEKEDQKEIFLLIAKEIQKFSLNGFTMSLVLENRGGDKRWILKFKNLTHKNLDIIAPKLVSLKLKFKDIPLNIYSES